MSVCDAGLFLKHAVSPKLVRYWGLYMARMT
jgi:hypothetical protein